MGEKRRTCAKCGRGRAERFYTSPRGRTCLSCRKARSRSNSRNRRIFETYGLTEVEYDSLFAAQDGRCAICGGTRKQKLSVDHRHVDGLIRGLLCRLCNGRLLTAAKDLPAVLRAAADYLEQPPAVAVLGERLVPSEFQHGRNTNRRVRAGRRGHKAAEAGRVE